MNDDRKMRALKARERRRIVRELHADTPHFFGALIADGAIDFLVFFWDPLEPQPHDTDVKALLRRAVVWNIPVACNRATADFMISSPLMTSGYERHLPDYQAYVDRFGSPGGET